MERRIEELTVDDKLESYQKQEQLKREYLINKGIIIDREKSEGRHAHYSPVLHRKSRQEDYIAENLKLQFVLKNQKLTRKEFMNIQTKLMQTEMELMQDHPYRSTHHMTQQSSEAHDNYISMNAGNNQGTNSNTISVFDRHNDATFITSGLTLDPSSQNLHDINIMINQSDIGFNQHNTRFKQSFSQASDGANQNSTSSFQPFKQTKHVTPVKSVNNRPLKFDHKKQSKFDRKLLQYLMDEHLISAENVRNSKYSKQEHKPFINHTRN